MLAFSRGLINLKREPTAVAIGNFDGVHLGHQQVIKTLLAQAQSLQVPATVVLFEPQPLEFLNPQKAPARLSKLTEKLHWLNQLGTLRVLSLRFNQSLAALSATDFINTILVQHLQAVSVVVGHDFRFGYQRQGDFALLQQAGQHYGFISQAQPDVIVAGERVSSTAIRQALAQADFQHAASLLGRPYTMSGRVGYGQQLGRTLGFPTANIAPKRLRLPLAGVYVVKVHGLAESYFGVANIGMRPTVGGVKPVLEVHILNFDADIYGQHLRIEFLTKLRNEQRFESLEALRLQIAQDVKAAYAYVAEL